MPEEMTIEMQAAADKSIEEIRAHMAYIISRLTECRERINNSKTACDRVQERIRIKCVEQVRERH